MVLEAIRDGDLRFHRYHLHSFVVMANHVHLLVTPQVPSRDWLGPLKASQRNQGKRILGGNISRFWQDESYDHLIRNDQEFERVRKYIERNPVTAGLVGSPEEFQWSSATPGRSPAAAETAAPPSSTQAQM